MLMLMLMLMLTLMFMMMLISMLILMLILMLMLMLILLLKLTLMFSLMLTLMLTLRFIFLPREVRSHAFPPILQLSSLSLAHTAITTLPQVVVVVVDDRHDDHVVVDDQGLLWKAGLGAVGPFETFGSCRHSAAMLLRYFLDDQVLRQSNLQWTIMIMTIRMKTIVMITIKIKG